MPQEARIAVHDRSLFQSPLPHVHDMIFLFPYSLGLLTTPLLYAYQLRASCCLLRSKEQIGEL